MIFIFLLFNVSTTMLSRGKIKSECNHIRIFLNKLILQAMSQNLLNMLLEIGFLFFLKK